MENKFFTQSEKMSQEYCCTVVRLGEILEIPGANTVAKTLVNGRTIVIGKDHKPGDVMIYCSNESQLNFDFLSVNNLFEKIDLNCNAEEVNKWLEEHVDASDEEIKEYKRTHRGYFDEKGRVRMKKLAGEMSMGVLFELEQFKNWCPMLDVDLEKLVGLDFDTVNGVLFIKAYVPESASGNNEHPTGEGPKKPVIKMNCMIPGQFAQHYDTQLFEKVVKRFSPNDVVTISNKLHGTSYRIGNVLTIQPKWNGLYKRIFLYLPKFMRFTKDDYSVIYASHQIVKNGYISTENKRAVSGLDRCYRAWYEILDGFIPEGITLYGEIVGYVDGSNSFVQTIGQGYDYGCKPGVSNLMIYRVKRVMPNGEVKEYNVGAVQTFASSLKSMLIAAGKREEADRIRLMDVFYHGKLGDLYPDIPQDEHWNANLLERMKNDKEHFGMEGNEPMCRNSVPREGIVIRIDDDTVPEAFKLKCLKFLGKEAKEIDKGTTDNTEMIEHYES